MWEAARLGPQSHQKSVHRTESVPNHGVSLVGIRHRPLAGRRTPEEGRPQTAMHGWQVWLPSSGGHHVWGQHLHSHHHRLDWMLPQQDVGC